MIRVVCAVVAASGLLAACVTAPSAGAAPSTGPASLAGTSWRLVHFQSSDDAIGTLIPPRVDRYTLAFGADGALALGLDCNRGRGSWEAKPSSPSGGSLSITGGAMTRAMCPPGALDGQIARDLSRVRSYTFAGGRLSLALEADGGIYLWAPDTGGR